MSGTLTLIPTPIDEESPLEQTAFLKLESAWLKRREESLFVIEDLKPGRRRWLRWGLPREAVGHFFLYNEHNNKKAATGLLTELQNGKNVYLMSDGGLPAFCDPGRELVDLCHLNKIKITSTPFCNSVILALALSGMAHDKFLFYGFLPVKKHERSLEIESLLKEKGRVVLMDTPYRLQRLLEELDSHMKKSRRSREIFLALDLNSAREELLRDNPSRLLKMIKNFKREFVLIL